MKKVITVIVLLAFLSASVFAAPASAVVTEALLVAGGVMTVGLVASIIICAAAGGGMNSVINEKSASLGLTPKSFITQKIGEYCQETGMSTPNLLRLFMSGTAISPGNPFDPGSGVATAGNLLLTGSLAIWLTGFFSWLWNGESNDDQLEDIATPNTALPDVYEDQSKSAFLYKFVCNTAFTTSSGVTVYYDSTKPYIFRSNTSYITVASVNSGDIVYVAKTDVSSSYYVLPFSSSFYVGADGFYTVNLNSSGVATSGRLRTGLNTPPGNEVAEGWRYFTIAGTWNSVRSVCVNYDFLSISREDIGGVGSYKENPLVFDPDQLGKPTDRFVVGIGETVKEDTDDPDFPPDVIVGKIPVGDYIEQVAGIYSGTDTSLKVETDEGIVDVPVELTDAGTGVIADAGTIPVVIADEQDVVVADSEQVAEATEDMELDEYTMDLTDFFPFCVPFDIYNMLQLFSDTAEAPNFDWRFYVPGVLDYTLEVDLSDFDPLAEVLRRLELIAFAVALAFATKNIIQGGD